MRRRDETLERKEDEPRQEESATAGQDRAFQASPTDQEKAMSKYRKELLKRPEIVKQMRKYDHYGRMLDLIELDVNKLSKQELRELSAKMQEQIASELVSDWWTLAGVRNYGWC